jgi:hypothetical protein
MYAFFRQSRGNLLRLANPDLIEIQVRNPLAAALQIPICGAVTNQKDLHNLIQSLMTQSEP